MKYTCILAEESSSGWSDLPSSHGSQHSILVFPVFLLEEVLGPVCHQRWGSGCGCADTCEKTLSHVWNLEEGSMRFTVRDPNKQREKGERIYTVNYGTSIREAIQAHYPQLGSHRRPSLYIPMRSSFDCKHMYTKPRHYSFLPRSSHPQCLILLNFI